MSRPVVVYGLRDPRSGEIRYVGCCYLNRTNIRFKEHCERSKSGEETSKKAAWLATLQRKGFLPEWVDLEVATFALRGEAERRWIAKLWADGCRLTNSTNGGAGNPGSKRTPEQIEKIRNKLLGKKKSKEHRRKLSIIAQNRKFSAETRRKMSEAHRGRKMSPEAVEKTASAHRGMKRSVEAMLRMSEGRRLGMEKRGRLYGATKDGNRWRANACFGGLSVVCGWFKTAEEASQAALQRKQELIAEYCRRQLRCEA